MTAAQDLTFGQFLRRCRRAAGLTQDELAEQASLSARVISDLERGVIHRPRKDTVQLLADALALAGQEREAFQRAAQRLGGATALGAELPLRPPPTGAQGPATPPTNLPNEPTPFIGRQHEIAALAQLLPRDDHRLVTLTGPGGSGKTRLALEVAFAHLPTFADGVFLVSLAPLTIPDLVAPTIAVTLGITDGGEQALLEMLKQTLQGKHLLLVLDNFEHLLDAAPLVGDLLRSCPSLQILVTSRSILHLSMEREFPVPPLSLPELDLTQDLRALARSDAVALFVDRAQAARPDFVLTKGNGPYVAALCHRLDGLPLALELAAARIRLFPPQALLGRLAHRWDLLTGGALDRPARQQTLRGTIDWSYSLLSPDEQMLFARLGVFAGGWTLEAAEAVCATEGKLSLSVLDGVASLVDQSLVRQEGENESRFGMLETIREYAVEKLAQSEEECQIREAHARYFLETARQAVPELRGPDQGAWLARLERELDNIRSALGWLRDHGGSAIGLELAAALGTFWSGRGHVVEGLDWLSTFLSACPESSELRGSALNDVSFLASLHGETEEARRFAEEALRIAREQGDVQQIARALSSASRIMLADRNIERVLELTREGIAIARRIGDNELLALHLLSRAEGMRMVHNHTEARRLYMESLELYRGLGMIDMVASNLHNLIEVELDEGNVDQAAELFREKVGLAHRLRHAWIDAYTVLDFARLTAARGNLPLAARLLAAATRMFLSTGVLIDPVERAGYDSTLSLLREELEDEELASLWEEGRALSSDEVLTYALEERGRILEQ